VPTLSPGTLDLHKCEDAPKAKPLMAKKTKPFLAKAKPLVAETPPTEVKAKKHKSAAQPAAAEAGAAAAGASGSAGAAGAASGGAVQAESSCPTA
jgi:hypothetical protein